MFEQPIECCVKTQYPRFFDKEQCSPFQDKAKILVNGSAIPYCNNIISRNSSPSTRTSAEESSIDAMLLSEQDLGSDAESLPSCGDSYTASESPPNSPELELSNKCNSECNRRISAPEMMNNKSLQIELDEVNFEKYGKVRRRNSSVEVRPNRVRFQLEESFKEEEDRYQKQFETGDNLPTEAGDQVNVMSASTEFRKVSCPPNLNTHPERRRKVSIYSDTSEGSLTLERKLSTPNTTTISEVQSNANKNERTNLPVDRKLSLPDPKLSSSKQNKLGYNPFVNRKISLQEKGTYDRKTSLQEKQTNIRSSDRKISLQEQRKLSLQSQERKISYQERKISLQDRKLSLPQDHRKLSSHERKLSSNERKNSSSERKVSLTDTLRSVVGTKKKTERKSSNPDPSSSPDENNNTEKKSTWGILKNKMKKDRKSSGDLSNSPKHSPRQTRVLSRNDSSSSVDSYQKTRSNSVSKSERRLHSSKSEGDRRSITSITSDLDSQDSQVILPARSFDLWSEGKVDIRLEQRTLPLLHVAAGEGNYNLLKTLIDVGVEINEIDPSGWPALHYAVCAGHFQCAQLLIEKGAKLNQYSNQVANTYCSTIRNSIRTSSMS